MAASSAAFNVEIMAYYILNSFGQACTTFVGQNYGAGQIDRCRKALKLCLIESVIATACAVAIALASGKYLIALFNNDPEVIRLGMVRLKFIFYVLYFLNDLRLHVRLHARLRHFADSCAAYDIRRVRNENNMDLHGVPHVADL